MILIGLGANLPSDYGSPVETLEIAKIALEKKGVIKLLKSSQTYLSAPVMSCNEIQGKNDKNPWYANAVSIVETSLKPKELLSLLNEIETEFGRVRTYKDAPRVLDLDIIAYHNEIINDEENTLCIPHPRMHNRAFVLKPLQDIAPDWIHPFSQQAILSLLSKIEQEYPLIFRQTIPLAKGESYRVSG